MKSTLPSLRLLSALLAVCGLATASAQTQTTAPAYYAAAIIPYPADFTTRSQVIARAMNDQGYVLLYDSGVAHPPLVYINGQTYELDTTGLDVTMLEVGSGNLSNTAADGSFRVVGTYTGTDSYRRVITWTVQPDGSSVHEVLQNIVLPEGSQQPGEQNPGGANAVNNAGLIVGFSQSYLLSLGVYWVTPGVTANRIPALGEGAVYDVDDTGFIVGTNPPDAVTVDADGNVNPLPNFPDHLYAAAQGTKGGFVVGNYDQQDASGHYGSHAFVYNTADGTTVSLPTIEPPYTQTETFNDAAQHLNAAGDMIVGQAGNQLSPVLWKKDATGAYQIYTLQYDLLTFTTLNGTGLIPPRGSSDNQLVGVAADGSLVASYVTSESAGLPSYTGPSELAVLLKPGPDPRPLITSATAASTEPGQTFSYQITASNNPTSYRLLDNTDPTQDAALPAGLSFDSTKGTISGTGPALGLYTFVLAAYNGQGIGAISSYLYLSSGDAPVVTSATTASGTVGQVFSPFQITATNSPNSFSANNLPPGLGCDYQTGLITGTPTQAGTFAASVTVGNAVGDNSANPGTLTFTITPAAPPVTPAITSATTAAATVGQPFSYQIMTVGLTPPTTYYVSYLPDGLTVDANGLISGTPASDNPLPVYNVALDARDSLGNDAVATLTINLAGTTGTAPTPVITSPATATATVGQAFSFQVTASNITPTYYAAYGLPDGLTINNATGLISGTPLPDDSGVIFNLQLFVSDNATHNAGGVLSITVNPAGTATPTPSPSPSPSPDPTPVSGTDDLTIATSVSPDPLVQNGLATYHVVVTNHGPDTATGVKVYVDYDTNLTFVAQGSASVVQQTATFLSVPLADLLASGTGASTSFDLIFRVTASGGTVACSTSVTGDQNDANIFDNNVDLITTVNGGTPAAHAPTINAPAGGTITVGQTFGYQITTLGDVAVDTYGATGLPDGLAIDAASGVITGTPTADAKLGAASVTLSASNGAGRSTSTRMFTVVAAPTGKTSDVFGTLTGLKVTPPTGDGTTGKYVFKGSVSITNQGKKPAKKVAVGLYLSNSPYFSFPAVANDLSLSQIAVFLDTSNPLKPALELTPAGSTVMTAVLPITLAKAGDPFSTLGPVPFKLKLAAKRVNTAAANYRYLLVVIDPANTLKESNKANNVIAIDLRPKQ